MISRVSTSTLNRTMLDASMRIQAQVATVQEQISSGLKAGSYADLGGGIVERTLSLESAMSRSQSITDGIATASARGEMMYAGVGDMIDMLTTLRSNLSAASTGAGTDAEQIPVVAEGLLEDMEQAMNLRYEGRYLFAGSNTTEAPVDVSALAVPTIPSVADTSYYGGGTGAQTVRLSEDLTISYGANAEDDAFETTLRALNIAANLTTSPLDEDAVAEAYELATSAIDALTAIQSGLSNAVSRMETAQAGEETTQAFLSETFSDLTAVDVAEATVQLSQYQTQLEASYASISKVMSTRLMDYLL